MKYTCKIDHQETTIRDGFTIIEELNETLDSGTIQFVSHNGTKDIDPFDSVVFNEIPEIDFERKKLLVDAYSCEIYNFNNNNIFNSDFEYLTNIFSETKGLERITLPNLAITKRANGTARTVWEVIKDYCKRYLPKIKVYDSTYKFVYKSCYEYDKAMETKFNMECPEFVWNNPTLKEVLLDLMSVANCIPVVKDNVLTFFDLTTKGSEIDTSKLTNVQLSATSADYCDKLTLPMKNVISKQPVIVNEFMLPHSTSGEMNSNNAVYITKKPIYKIIKATMFVYRKENAIVQKLASFDITEFVREKEQFDLLSSVLYPDSEEIWQHKATSLWFKRGENTINNLGASYNRINVGGGTHPVWAWLFYFLDDLASSPSIFEAYGFDAPMLQLEYETYGDNTINVSKQDTIKNANNSLFDSQSANAIDLYHQTIFEYAKANRLASKIITIYGEYKKESDIPKLSDYIGNKILFHREITYYDEIMFFKGMLCDNYILRDYFTGVNSKERSWKIVDTNDAIIRNDIYNMYVTFTRNNRSDILSHGDYNFTYSASSFAYNMLMNFTNFVTDYDNKQCKIRGAYAFSKFGQTRYPTENFAILDCITFTGENVVSVFASQNDNLNFGDKVSKEEDGSDIAYIMDSVPYANENGETTQYNIYIQHYIEPFRSINKTINDFLKLTDQQQFDKDDYDEFLGAAREVPVIKTRQTLEEQRHSALFSCDFTKDNREIIASTIEFEYVSNDEDIIVNEDIAKIVPAGNCELNPQEASGDWQNNIGFKLVRNHKYNRGDTEPLGNEIQISVQSISSEHARFYYEGSLINKNDAWCIYSKITGKILVAINGLQQFYMNINYTRDDKIFNNILDRKPIGTLYDTQAELNTSYANNPKEVKSVKLFNRVIDEDDIENF